MKGEGKAWPREACSTVANTSKGVAAHGYPHDPMLVCPPCNTGSGLEGFKNYHLEKGPFALATLGKNARPLDEQLDLCWRPEEAVGSKRNFYAAARIRHRRST